MATPLQTLTRQRDRLQAQLDQTTTQIGQLESREISLTASVSNYNDAINELTPPAPTNSVAPVASGTTTLSVTNGTWDGSPTSYAYQWQASDDGVGGWADIPGATNSTYVVDEEVYLRCVVTATNEGGSTAENSNVIDLS